MVFSLLAPSRCVRCSRPPDRLCARCAAELFASKPTSRGALLGVRLAQVNRSTLRIIRTMKDGGETALLRVILGASGLAALGTLRGAGPRGSILFVPIPSSRSSWRKRGFNLAHELARWLATNCAEPALVSAALELVYEPLDQRGLGGRERARNVDGAMAVDGDRIHGEVARLAAAATPVTIVLCDDVVTTGSTLLEARRALEAAFAEEPEMPNATFFAVAETLTKNGAQVVARV